MLAGRALLHAARAPAACTRRALAGAAPTALRARAQALVPRAQMTTRVGPDVGYAVEGQVDTTGFKSLVHLGTSGMCLTPAGPGGLAATILPLSLDAASGAALLACLRQPSLPPPVLLAAPDASLASGAALLWAAARARLDGAGALRLGAALGLPCALEAGDVARWVAGAADAALSGAAEGLVFRQMLDDAETGGGSCTLTYLLADADTKEALLIDPVLEQVDRDLALVAELGLRLTRAINTHCHADHVTGTGELKRRVPGLVSGIAAASGAAADEQYRPGDVVRVGRHALRVIATPGHTDGCVSYHTASGGGMVFTGDALLIRGCGRTDFQQGCPERLHASVTGALFALPPTTRVYPAHDYAGRSASSVAEERALNPRLTKPLPEFVAIMNGLGLPRPKKMDVAVPANLCCDAR